MPRSLLDEVVDLNENGVLTTKMITENGIHRGTLRRLVEDGTLVKCARGVYMFPDEWEDEMFILQLKYKKGIFSHTTALYLQGYSERVPLRYHMTFPSRYNTTAVQRDNVEVTRVIADYYELGITELKTPYGNMVRTYNLERSLCDVVRGAGDDIQIVQYAMKKYAASKEKDINQLMRYARVLRVEPKVSRYMEVLL